LLSDFLPNRSDEITQAQAQRKGDDDFQRVLRVMSRKHDLIPIIITDPLEHALPKVGLLELVDSETGEQVYVDTLGAEATAYAKAMVAQQQAREAQFKKLNIEAIDITTHRPCLPALIAFFRAREQRKTAARN
jgi:uncharacterized protein (DUF58 family)